MTLIETVAHALCPHLRAPLLGEKRECQKCPESEVNASSGLPGARLCRMFAEDAARAAISAIESSGTHRIVPVTPDERMVEAMKKAAGMEKAEAGIKLLVDAGLIKVNAFRWTGDAEYRAAIAAAPKVTGE